MLLIGLIGCNSDNDGLFQLVSTSHSGLDFRNDIYEDDYVNVVKMEYLYNGGGVAIADFNKDGLQDVFFTGNQVPNRLYLNEGDLEFRDVSAAAGIDGGKRWKSGIAVGDVNEDGWPDLYVCATIAPDTSQRRNLLYIHQGLNDDGEPVFKDEAAAYGVDDANHSSNAAFLDYDNDGDLDLYVLTNVKRAGVPTIYRPKVNDGTHETTDRLYRNDGNGSFTDVSTAAGITYEGYGLGINVFDVNGDGLSDIYVSNDFLANDVLYVNKGGYFENQIDSLMKHQSKFSMGNDVADINNDGHPDLITLDMQPDNNLRKKTVMSDAGYIVYVNDLRYGYQHQYTRNMVQLNNGDGTFSEVGQLLGLHQTEWSWSPLWADFDNDGDLDLAVTNGFPRDITDRDFSNFRQEVGPYATPEYLVNAIPSVKVPNYVFRNEGDLRFTDVSDDWNFTQPSFSNGAAFADFDNDGDLDYLVNNINDEPFLYKNTLYDGAPHESEPQRHYLRVKLEGPKTNPYGLGTKITLTDASGRTQTYEHRLSRGYISSVDPTAHFGLDTVDQIRRIEVRWANGGTEVRENVAADQVLTFKAGEAQATNSPTLQLFNSNQLLKAANEQRAVSYRQPNYDFIDFNVQRTIPHKFSQNSPALAVGDVNGDGLEDFVVGSYANAQPQLFTQRNDGTFAQTALPKANPENVDAGLLLFDADNDGDLDLYAGTGGFAYHANQADPHYRDRLYRNDGRGNFTEETDALDMTPTSTSVVRAHDFDGDGDLDLFVGGRVEPHRYPYAPPSQLLRNDNGRFVDATLEWAEKLSRTGMVTDALWTDVDVDGAVDLLVVGEFMPVRYFRNVGGKLMLQTDTGVQDKRGWFNSIAPADFDHDGDVDYVLGNLGDNNFYKMSAEHPLKVFAGDFDNNDAVDAILACYFQVTPDSEEKALCPVHFWDDLMKQSPRFRKQFNSYTQYGRATMDSLLTPEEQESALVLEANYPYTALLVNEGGGKLSLRALPVQAQVAPANGILAEDVNGDGFRDVILIGNDFGNEVVSGVYDALDGLVLLNDGAANFRAVPLAETGFRVPGDGKALVRLSDRNGTLYLASQNKGDLLLFERTNALGKPIYLESEAGETSRTVTHPNGSTERVEFYWGSGFLGQSSRAVVPSEVE